MKDAIKFALEALWGVGGNDKWCFVTNPPGVAVHVQKPLTSDEKKLIPQSWHDIPARDELGPCIRVDLSKSI